jgi:hypothetical protein
MTDFLTADDFRMMAMFAPFEELSEEDLAYLDNAGSVASARRESAGSSDEYLTVEQMQDLAEQTLVSCGGKKNKHLIIIKKFKDFVVYSV